MPSLPRTTITVDNDVQLEPLRPAKNVQALLSAFPDDLYNKNPDSTLIHLLKTLLGPAGLGWLRDNYTKVRMVFEENGLQFSQLERFYGNPLRFGRLVSETHDKDVTGALERESWDEIQLKDQSYKNRVIDFFHAARLGSTVNGMGMAARSGLGYGVNIFENYNYHFDQNTDFVLGIENLGRYGLEEFVIIPDQEFSNTIVQTIKFSSVPTSGYFKLKFNNEETINLLHTATHVDVANALTGLQTIQNGDVTVQGSMFDGFVITFANLLSNQFVNTIEVLNYLTKKASSTTNYSVGTISSSGTTVTGVGTSFVSEMIGGSLTTGNQTKTITAVTSSTELTVNSAFNSPLNAGTSYTINYYPGTTINASVDKKLYDRPNSELVNITAQDKHAASTAIDYLKPMDAMYTFIAGHNSSQSQPVNSIFAPDSYHETIRHVTGNENTAWPDNNSVYWIAKGVEKAAPRLANDLNQNYANFHKPEKIYTYKSEAEAQTGFNSSNHINLITNATYVSLSTGAVNNDFKNKFKTLDFAKLAGTASSAAPAQTEIPLLTTVADFSSIAFINRTTPISNNIESVVADRSNFENLKKAWVSTDRDTGTVDYIELDLGSTKAINFVALETLKVPVNISIEYNASTSANSYSFKTVTKNPLFAWEDDIYYDPQSELPWEYLSFHFTDPYGDMIYTRSLRIKITRSEQSGFVGTDWLFSEWPVAIQNLRIGRII